MKTTTCTILITFVIGLTIAFLGGLAVSNNNNKDISIEKNRSMYSHDMNTMDHDKAMKEDNIIMYDEMSMDSMMMDMSARMIGKTGDELDRIFLEDMIPHHQGAVDMALILKEGTQRPELQKFADEIIRAQDAEVEIMQKWLMEWFPDNN
jgi:uncharacterized protein (DUF305 family)